jgi:hypothetical protein
MRGHHKGQVDPKFGRKDAGLMKKGKHRKIGTGHGSKRGSRKRY